MAFYKGTAFYELAGRAQSYGWSESIYMITQASLGAALNDFIDLTNKRNLLLGSGVLHVGGRVSDDLVFGDSLPTEGAIPKQETPPCYNPDFNTLPADFATSDMLFRLDAGVLGLYRRGLYLAGSPDILQGTDIRGILDSNDPNQAKWARKYQAWRTMLINGKYALKVWDRDPATAPEKPIIKIDIATGSVNVTNHGFVGGDHIFIRLAQTTGEILKGTQTVDTVIDANHFTILNLPDIVKYIGKGLVHKRQRVLRPITEVTPRRFGKRNRGRPFGLPVGRRPVKK